MVLLLLGLVLAAKISGANSEPQIGTAVMALITKSNYLNVQIVYDAENSLLATKVLKDLRSKHYLTQVHQTSDPEQMHSHCKRMKTHLSTNPADAIAIYFLRPGNAEMLLMHILKYELGGRNLLHVFLWQDWHTSSGLTSKAEAIRVAIFSSYTDRPQSFKLFSTHASARNPTRLYEINSWSEENGFLFHPVFLDLRTVFRNLKGRVLKAPVLHKPPWYFIKKSGNVSVEVIGGRDHQLLKEISLRMNFKFKYVDPTEKSQGIPTGSGKAGQGVLSLLRTREVDLFLGDAAVTYERTQDLDFSFFTVADSVAFVTHSPRPLSEAWALVRPFDWKVWLAVWVSIALFGPALHIVSKRSSFGKCVWKTLAILLKQSTKDEEKSKKARFVTILLWITGTYVIGDLYCANLTSLLAKPGRERPLKSILELERAARDLRYECYVEARSSEAEFLKNGTREAQRLWALMQQQRRWLVPSVERGMSLVRAQRGVALLASRETLLFELQRFGQRNFYLSDPLSTQYAAIALQQGCPYLDNINDIVMQLFEAGILNRMTALEYARLGSQFNVDKQRGDFKANVLEQENSVLQAKPMTLKMLQGAFLVLAIGFCVAGLALLVECVHFKNPQRFTVSHLKWRQKLQAVRDFLKEVINKLVE